MGFLGSDGRIKGGGLLCDDMGLGKTIITLGLLLCNFKKKNINSSSCGYIKSMG